MSGQQAGWYADPSGDPSKLRYWDGLQWTDNYSSVQPSQPYGAQGAPYGQPAGQYGAPGYYGQPVQVVVDNGNEQILRLVAFILCLLSTISVGWLLIPLAWMIPMTVHCWGIYKGTKANTVAFGVCTLIFLNFVGGILLLVSKKDA